MGRPIKEKPMPELETNTEVTSQDEIDPKIDDSTKPEAQDEVVVTSEPEPASEVDSVSNEDTSEPEPEPESDVCNRCHGGMDVVCRECWQTKYPQAIGSSSNMLLGANAAGMVHCLATFNRTVPL
jgi:hypothetical protein